MADALTSLLAIGALGAGMLFGWAFLDPLMGVVGALIIGRWAYGLAADSARALLDAEDHSDIANRVRAAMEAVDDVEVADLHLWRIGAHLEDLPFGEQVAAGLTDEPIEILRILVGISGRVRLIPLVAADGSGLAAYAGDQSRPLGRALIPRSVWAMQEPVYVAVEVFLRECGSGRPDDWNLARELIRHMLKCCP